MPIKIILKIVVLVLFISSNIAIAATSSEASQKGTMFPNNTFARPGSTILLMQEARRRAGIEALGYKHPLSYKDSPYATYSENSKEFVRADPIAPQP